MDLDPELIEALEQDPWRALARVSSLLTSRAVDLQRTLAVVLEVVLSLGLGDRALLLLRNDEGELDVQLHRDLGGGDPRRDQFSWTIVRRMFETGRALHVPDIAADVELAGAESVQQMRIRSAFCVPLESGLFPGAEQPRDRRRFPAYLGRWQEVVGALYVDGERRRPASDDDLALLGALANTATAAIISAQLYQEATRDHETGLFTRRQFELLLPRVHRLATRWQFPYGLLLIAVGPDAPGGVETAGLVLPGLLRQSDLAARHGSATLAALLPYAGAEDVQRLAARVADTLGPVRVGGSAVPQPATDAAELVRQADRALACAGDPAPAVFWTPQVGIEGPGADRLAGLVTGCEGADHQALERLVEERRTLAAALAGQLGLVGQSPALRAVSERVAKVAPTPATVLLQGESGTGKELAARALHALSPRAAGPLVVVDCGAIPEKLVESELFGHEAGAFTGAERTHIGKFEQADGGTIFLDEVGELPLALQPRFLRALQESEIQRVGGARPIRLDIRVVAATNRDLAAAVSAGEFREDLYYRLNQLPIALPPLRERGDDVLLLARHFLERSARRLRRPVTGFDEDARRAMLRYFWPGNVRELEHRIQQAVILAEDPLISAADLALPGEAGRPESFKEARARAMEAFEQEFLSRLLSIHDGDTAAVASEMDLSERRVRELRQKFGLGRHAGEVGRGSVGGSNQ